MNILFLDIDGVLVSFRKFILSTIESFESWMYSELAKRLPILNEAVTKFDFKVVIHSTWRFQYDLSWFQKNIGDFVIAVTDPQVQGREASIIDFIEQNIVNKYVILDDCSNAFTKLSEYLIVTEPYTGLELHHINQISEVIDA